MLKLKIKTQTMAITLLMLITTCIAISYTVKVDTIKKSIETSTSQNTRLLRTLVIKTIDVVVVRKNQLLMVSLNNKSKNIILDSGGTFSRPIISPDKKHVSYLKDDVLYITTIESSHIKVTNSVSALSFTWKDENTLLYSPTSGGLYIYDLIHKTSKLYLHNVYNYQNITLDKSGKIYAEQYLYSKKNGSDYRNDYGIVSFNPITKEERIVVKSIPSKIDTGGDLGMYPIITSISKDDKYLYIWKHPHAGSLAADGVNLAVYDILNNKLIQYKKPAIISLPYKDNISPNPKNSRYLSLINGAGREMGDNKNLIVLDVLTGKFQSLLPKTQASMTPYYLSDGNTILYASSERQKNETGALTKWLSSGNHHIFSIDTTTKQIKQITNNSNYFDFAPMYISSKDFIFFRSDKTENVSIWKYSNGHEIKLADGLIFYDDMNYPVQNYNGHFDTTLFTDIR